MTLHTDEKPSTEVKEVFSKNDSESYDEEADQVFQKEFVTGDVEKKYLRKVNWTFLPLVTWIVMVQFADKSALAISAVLGIYEDTKISGSQFSWLGSIFFLGYLIYQIPNNIFMQKLPVARYLGVNIVLWGLVMFFTALCNTFSQLAAVRFFLGLFEATCLPCIYLIVSTLYRRSEQPFYFSVSVMCQGIGSVLGNLVAYGISYMGERNGITMWRWNHIIFGAITCSLGIITFFFLIDSPSSRLLRLTEEEKEVVRLRTEDNAVVRHHKIKYNQILEALGEVRFWCICLAALGLNMQNGGLLVFSAQIIKTLGQFTSSESILLKMPGGVASTVFTILGGIVARRTQQINITGFVMCLISVAGVIVLAAAPHGIVKLVGYYLSWGMSGASAMYIAIIGSNVSGYTKKIFYNSCMVAAGTVGNFIGPLVMLDSEKPTYKTGMIVFSIGNGVAMASFVIMRMLMQAENKRRLANPPSEPVDVTLDLTDKQNKAFIYRL